MTLFQVLMPSNAGIFFRHVMEIAAFDFFDFDDIIHENFNIEPTEPADIRFGTLGFESLYFLVNLGTMAVFFLLYLFFVILALTFKLFYKLCE